MKIVLGSKVKMAGITDQSIPAYRDMRGEVIAIGEDWCEVSWLHENYNGKDEDVFSRSLDTVELAEG